MHGRPRRSAQSNLPAKNVPIEEPANLNIKKDLPIGISSTTKEEEKLAKQEKPSMGTNIEPFIKGINEGEGTKMMDIGTNAEEKFGEKNGIGHQQIPKGNEFVPITSQQEQSISKPIRRRGAKPIEQQQIKPKIEHIGSEEVAKKNLMATNKDATVERSEERRVGKECRN